eukprot:Sspe_Gene.72455::Locus_43261_Transcript_1_1_Confidence_1.000_Length_1222::g.72455::m.72455
MRRLLAGRCEPLLLPVSAPAARRQQEAHALAVEAHTVRKRGAGFAAEGRAAIAAGLGRASIPWQDWTARDCSMVLYASSCLWVSSVKLAEVHRAAAHLAPTMDNVRLCTVIWSMARLSASPAFSTPLLWEAARRDMAVEEVSTVICAIPMGKGYAESGVLPVLLRRATTLICEGRIGANGVVRILEALATLHERCGLLEWVLLRRVHEMGSLTPDAASRLCCALGELSVSLPEVSSSLADSLVPVERIGSLWKMAAILRAFARLSHASPSLFSGVAAAVTKAGDVSPAVLTSVLLSHLRVRMNGTLYDHVSSVVATSHAFRSAATPRQMVGILWGLLQAGRTPPLQEMGSWFGARLRRAVWEDRSPLLPRFHTARCPDLFGAKP